MRLPEEENSVKIFLIISESSQKNGPSTKITDFLKSLKYVMVELNPEFQKTEDFRRLGEVKWIRSW
jgi:hypothetical protein